MKEYPSFVKDVDIINNGKYQLSDGIWVRHNLVLTIKGKHKGETLTFCLMNPSIADTIQSDATVNKMLEFSKFLIDEDERFSSVNRIIILNLIPFYQPQSKKLSNVIDNVSNLPNNTLESVLNTNQQHLKKQLYNTHYVVLGWGNIPPKVSSILHKDQRSKILNILKPRSSVKGIYSMESAKRKGLTNKKQPRHPKYLAKASLRLIEY